jgi:hypothetical protein
MGADRTYPRYSYPIHMLAGLVLDALLDRHRKFADDARACLARLSPPLRVLGARNIPTGGSYVITPNHYYRRGFASQWSALAVSALIPADVHWVMTGELTFPARPWFALLGKPLSRLALGRVAQVYGFTAMPPMPPRPRDVAARAGAVRRVLRYAATAADPIIALAPEGGDQPYGRLSMPPSGAGRFCLLLAEAGLRFLPVGIYERNGQLNLHFGELYTLHAEERCSADEKDRLAAFAVMSHIAGLLPSELRGDFVNAHVL